MSICSQIQCVFSVKASATVLLLKLQAVIHNPLIFFSPIQRDGVEASSVLALHSYMIFFLSNLTLSFNEKKLVGY